MEIEDLSMRTDTPVRTRVYGTLTIYFHFMTAWLLTFGAVTGVVVILDTMFHTGSHPPHANPFIPDDLAVALAFTFFFGLLPVFCVLMHSPRTCSKEIRVGTDQNVPALVLCQSRLIYTLAMIVALPALTAGIVFLLRASEVRADREFNSIQHEVGTWVLLLTVMCGWQVGVAVAILLGRVRPGYIAIRHDGIHLRGYANDAWIPWDSISPYLRTTHHQNLTIQLAHDHHAIISSRVPRLWTHIDKRIVGHAHPSRPRERRTSVAIDRRPFRIAPEVIDAAVEHFYENPAAREELRDPTAIARTVDILRSQATTAWWRSQTRPVALPVLTIDGPRGHFSCE